MVRKNVTTLNLNGEAAVQFDKGYDYFFVNNLSENDVMISMSSGIAEKTDGIIIVPEGSSAGTMHGYAADTVYVKGTGKVQVMGTYSAFNPFKKLAKGGEIKTASGSNITTTNSVDFPLLALTAYGRSWQSGKHIVSVADVGINGYGLPVSSEGNYTDANGQQWICDELIVNADGTGKIVRRTHKESINISDCRKVVNVNTTLYSYELMMYSTSYVVEKLLSVSNTYRYNTIDNPHYYADQRNLRIYISNDKVGAFESNGSISIVYDITNQYETELTAEQIAALQPVIDRYGAFTAYFMSTQNGTPTPENPVEIVSTADLHRVSVPIESIGNSGSLAVTTTNDDEASTAVITTALPLRGIPVDSGGNYTDSMGQEWICDTLEYNYSAAVKMQRIAAIDSYNGEIVGDNYISTTGGLDVGASVIYPAETVTETPLTAYEINQLRGFVTFDGTTNIYNNENAEMAVEYLTSKAVSKAVMPIITVLRGDSNV